MYKILLTVSLFSFLSNHLDAQDPKVYALKADKLFRDSAFAEAEESYRKANALHPEFKYQYNIGNSLYNQGRTKEAADYYEKSLAASNSENSKSKVYYNLGNSYFNQKQYDKSIEAYKESLKRNPNDLEAKNNLVLAKKQLQIQQQQQ